MRQERDIKLYMFLRLMMLISVLISLVAYQRSGILSEKVILNTYVITFFTFLVTTVLLVVSEKAKAINYFLTSQVLYDILFTTALIYYTGPSDTMYMVFYFFNIIFAAILFRGTGALAAAIASGVFYSIVNVINSNTFSDEKYFSLLTTLTAFVAIALLSGQLMEELSKSRQRIKRLEKLSEEIVESLDSGLLGLGPDGTIEKVNRTAQQLLGITASVFGKKISEVLPEIPDTVGSHLSQIFELNIKEDKRRFLVTRVALPENNSMILLRDLSEVLNLEERLRRQERLASIGKLAAGVAHEIRNPVASISGAAQIIEEGASHGNVDALELKRLMDIIVRETERVDRLVSQLLQFAKPTTLDIKEVNLKQIIEESVEENQARADFKGLGIAIKVKTSGDLKLKANKDALKEVINNLVVNSIQSFQEGAKSNPVKKDKAITVKAERVKDQIHLVVSDNGTGIPSHFVSRVFDPFFTTKTTGTGLGLAQVHKIIRDHNGDIDVESEEGKGTTLKVRLPA